MYDYENLLKANIPLDRKSLCTGKQVTVENINSAVDQIGKLYDDTAKSTLGLRHNRNYHTGRGSTRHTYREQKPWFDDNCKKKRGNFHKARKVYNLFKNNIYRDQLNKTSREFKRALNNGFMIIKTKSPKILETRRKMTRKFFGKLLIDAPRSEKLTRIFH